MTRSALRALWTSIFLASLPLENASAQLSTSPPVELNEIVVTEEPGAAPSGPAKTKKAPTAAEQSATPASPSDSATGSGSELSDAVAGSSEQTAVSPTGILSQVKTLGSSVTVVTRPEIEARQYRTVPEILRTVPGVQVVQGGGPGARTSVFLRGTDSDHTKVYIDGIDVSDPSSGGRTFDFGQLLTADIERIEVLRGPQSGLYGADALGGVIVIYTKKGEGPPQATGMIEGGSFGTFNQSASLSGATDKFDYAFNIAHFRADAVPVTPSEILLPGTRRFDNSYDNLTLSTKLGYEISPALTINGVARYTQADLDFTADSFDLTTFDSRPENYQSYQSNEQVFTRGEAVWTAWGGALQSFFGVNYSFTSVDIVDPVDSANSTFSDGDRIKYDWRSIADLGPGWTVITGADYQNETLAADGVDADELNQGVYAEVQAEPFRNFFLAANVRYDDNESFGGITTWRVAPAYVIEGSGTKLKGSVGTGFKAPSLIDRFVDFPAFAFFANPDLQPEENLGYDVGFEQDVNGGRFRFGATYFHNDITNLIEFVSDPNTFTSTVINVGESRIWGIEAFAAADVTEDVQVRADYTFTDAINADTGEALARRPRHKVTVTAGWTPIEPLLLTASVNFVGESPDFDRVTFAPVTLPAYTVVNVAADYKVNERVSLIGRIDNLFDEDYEIPDGFEATGIGAFAGVRLRN